MNIYIVIFFQQLVASGTHLVAKTVTQQVDPVTLTFIRNVVSLAVWSLLFILRVRRTKMSDTFKVSDILAKKDWGKMLWLSFLCVPLNQFLYLYGIKFTLASNGALLYGMTPALVLVLAHFMLNEYLTRKRIIGVIVAFAGVSIVMFERGIDFGSDYFYGNVMIFLAVIAWSLYAIEGKKLMQNYGAFQISALSLIGGGILFMPIGIVDVSLHGFPSITFGGWIGILYLALGTSIVSYVLWFYILRKMDTTKAAVFSNAQPILTTILAVIFLSQHVTPTFIVGGVITIAGVLLTQRK